MRSLCCSLILLTFLGTGLARAEEPRRTRRLEPLPVRPMPEPETATAPVLDPPAPAPVPRPAVDWPTLLEPRVALEGLGRDEIICFQVQAPLAARWELVVREVDGPVAQIVRGEGPPPPRISWDGRLLDGGLAWSGMRYTYGLDFVDAAGDEDRIPGTGFVLPAYSRESPDGIAFLIPGHELVPARRRVPAEPGSLADPEAAARARLKRVAERLNRRGGATPVRIEVLAPDETAAVALAETLRGVLADLLDDPGRPVDAYAGVAAAAPTEGTVLITTTTVPAPQS